MIKFVALTGFAGSMLLSISVPAHAQFGSPNSCEYLQANNLPAYNQLCASGTRTPTEFETPILGDDSPPEVYDCFGSVRPELMPFGTRVRVATNCNPT